jgi:hypothetical protein
MLYNAQNTFVVCDILHLQVKSNDMTIILQLQENNINSVTSEIFVSFIVEPNLINGYMNI